MPRCAPRGECSSRKLVATAGSDYVPSADLEATLLAALDTGAVPRSRTPMHRSDRCQAVAVTKPSPRETARRATAPNTTIRRSPRQIVARRRSGRAALAAGAAGVLRARHDGSRRGHARRRLDRAARDDRARGRRSRRRRQRRSRQRAWKPLRAHESVPPGAKVKTDERTRTSIELADGTHARARSPDRPSRSMQRSRGACRLESGRIVADFAHVEGRPAQVATPQGTIDVVGTRF